MMGNLADKIRQNPWLAYPLVALTYFSLGKLAFFLTADSGFAALIWPGAAIALAAVLFFGARIWPAIFVGAFLSTLTDPVAYLLNPQIFLERPHLAFIAGGATLQAVVAGWAVRHLNLFRHDFNNPATIGLFYLVAGPLCCLISASVAAITFYAFGLSSFIDLRDEWLIWWISDSTSTIVFCTFIFTCVLFEKERCQIIFLTLGIALMATVGIFYVGKRWENERIDLLFDQEVISAVNALHQIEDSHHALLNNLGVFHSFHSEYTREDFSRFARDNLPLNETLRSLAWVDVIDGDQRDEVEHELSEIFGKDVEFWQMDQDNNPITAQEQDQYQYVRFVEPYSIYPGSIGFVASSKPERVTAMQKAATTGEAIVTPPTVVSGLSGGLTVIIIYKAAFNDAAEVVGYSAALVNLDTLLEVILSDFASQDMEIEIRDTEASELATYRSGRVMDGYIDPAPSRIEVNMFDRTWALTFRKTLKFIERNKTAQPLYIGMAGMIFASLIAAGIVILSGQRSFLERLVARRTSELEKANETKSEFMANMSHDLRTPLNAIIGFSEIMKQELYGKLGTEKYREYVRDINQASEYLLSLINDILDFSAIDAGKRSIEREEIDPRALIDDCLRSLKPLIDEKDQVTEVILPDDLPELYADQRAMKQIFINLLSNSIKFTPPEGRITIEGRAAGQTVEFNVTDTGEGIEEENIEKILDPFTRVENHPHLSQEGTGLGLAIVNSLVRLHGGTLSIKSTIGQGTRVIFTVAKK